MKRTRLLLIAFLAFSTNMVRAAPPPPQTGNAKSIFDGRTLDGWESPSPNLWSVTDGCLTGGDGNKIPYNDFLCTKASYSNFILHLKIKLTGDPKTGMINSGIQIRTKRNPAGHEVCGYQCDYGEPGWYAGIYDEGRRNKFIAPADMAVIHPAVKLWDWNDYVIKAEGNRIQTWLNGVQGVDYKEQDPNIPSDGIIGIQVHGGGNTNVQVKDVFIEELPPTKGAPTWESLGGVEGVRKKLTNNKAQSTTKTGRDISYNANDAQPKTPEEEQNTFTLPKGFEIELVASESAGIGKFVTVDWDQKGRMWTQTALEYPVDGNENMERALALYASHGKDKVLVFDDTTGPAPHPFRVFTDGLAIPLGMMPYRNGVYVQHGPNIEFREDTDGDGKADKITPILTGFGVQDSHLFMHEFRRMPGNWIWGAQGAFNSGKVKTSTGVETDFPSTRMARFRPDGSQFEILCNGPCNIWGFEVTGEGEMFIQEANDFGYPVMPFHIGANYPGCADRLWKSYAPEFPGLAQFRMGGTGLSGLALANNDSAFVKVVSPSVGNSPKPVPAEAETTFSVMYVANPIIRKIQAIKIKPDGPRHALELLPDFLESSDPMFRPVSIHFGPDGALYIVDWYNKIISHNEVPRNHPDRDKTRGRIWRVKSRSDGFQASPNALTAGSRHSLPMPDLTTCAPDQLVNLLGNDNIKQSHLAWQAIVDRKLVELAPKLKTIISNGKAKTASRIEALWALEEMDANNPGVWVPLLSDPSRDIRREALASASRMILRIPIKQTLGSVYYADTWVSLTQLVNDSDPEVRAEVIHLLAPLVDAGRPYEILGLLVSMAKPTFDGPIGPSTRNGKPIKIAEAYDREFERYLIRQALEQHPEVVEAFLKSPEAGKLPLENRLLATLSLPAKTSAPLVAKLLGELKRPPNDEEILRLAEGLGDPAVNDALAAALKNPDTRQNIAAALLRLRTKLDANKLAPLLQTTAKELLDGNEVSQDLALQLAGEFQFAELETPIVALLKNWLGNTAVPAVGVTGVSPVTPAADRGRDAPDTHRRDACVSALRALGLMGSKETELFAMLVATEKDPTIRNEALTALASSKSADAGSRVLTLWKDLDSPGRRIALDRLTITKPGAHAVVAALKNKTLKADDLDAAALDRLQAVLGSKDPDLAGLMNELSALFRPVLRLDGGKDNYAETGLTLDGPFTVETWVHLEPGIGNEDGILGSPGQLDMNFFGSQFRVWVGGTTHDAIVAKKKMAPDNWTHIAVTRDAKGLFRIYIDGELDQDVSKPAPQKFENVRIGWAAPAKGTQGMLSEFRIWSRVRAPEEIRNNFDRGVEPAAKSEGLVFHGTGDQWGKLHGKARITKTSDLPPLLTPGEAKKLDEKFTKYRMLAQKPSGDAAKGKLIAGLCMGCHLIQGQGGNLAPNISGAATMGIEGLLRNIITPNAAMEAGYRTYRVELKNSDIVDAFFVNEDKDAVIVRLPGVPDRRIPRAEVRSTKYIRRSLMPEGILDALPPEMVTDLFAYLMSLKG